MNSVKTRLDQAARAALVLAFLTTAVHAQTAVKAPSDRAAAAIVPAASTPTNAQLQQEIQTLREQVRQLQQAQQGASATQKHAPAASTADKAKGGIAMGKPGTDKAQQGMGMHQGGMGMMDGMGMGMDKDKDESTEMLRSDPPTGGGMSAGMPDM